MTVSNKSALKNIVVIGTGGTIAGVGEGIKTTSYESGKVNVGEIVGSIQNGFSDLANVVSKDMFDVDSNDITENNIIGLANYINEASCDADIDGFVITHGTDTLEETAFFLNLTLKTSKPVVITGAMRPSTAISADGPFNLYQAVALARSREAVGKGVLIVFANGIYGARDICKMNCSSLSAFGQGDFGRMGYMCDDKAYIYNTTTYPHTKNVEFDVSDLEKLPRVAIVPFFIGADKDMLYHCSKNSKGIVILGTGSGECSKEWSGVITDLLSKNFPIVRCTRVRDGIVVSDENIRTRGVCGGTFSAYKARILLSLALTVSNDLDYIDGVFKKY
jgi:L-asparaginase